jgi:PHP family Zn ribbon phosphoesterase
MNYNIVRPVARQCTMCGYGPVIPRQTRTVDARRMPITEAKWVCSRCGNIFAKGVIDDGKRNT